MFNYGYRKCFDELLPIDGFLLLCGMLGTGHDSGCTASAALPRARRTSGTPSRLRLASTAPPKPCISLSRRVTDIEVNGIITVWTPGQARGDGLGC